MLFCETCDRPAKAGCRSSGHEIKRRYRSNKNLHKRCACSQRSWTCEHIWHFNYRGERGALGVSDDAEAKRKFSTIRAEIDNGVYVRPTAKPEPTPAVDRAVTFAIVASEYAKDSEGLANLSKHKQREHRYAVAFLQTVMVPPGVPFSEKPFAEIIRADVKTAIEAKKAERVKTCESNGRTWTRA